MKPYLENRAGTRYEINKITRRQKIEIQKILLSSKEEDTTARIEELEKIAKLILQYNYPSLTDTEYEDILDYNEEVYGFQELYEMLGYILEDVFTQASGGKTNPYLEEKRQAKAHEQE